MIGSSPNREESMAESGSRIRERHRRQRGLFEEPSSSPSWNALEEEVQTAVTTLVAGMLRSHWVRKMRGAEVEDE